MMPDAAQLSQLAEQGLLGLLLAITTTCLFLAIKLLLNEKDKRIQDAQQVRDNITAPLANIRDSIDLIQQKVTISKRAEHDDI